MFKIKRRICHSTDSLTMSHGILRSPTVSYGLISASTLGRLPRLYTTPTSLFSLYDSLVVGQEKSDWRNHHNRATVYSAWCIWWLLFSLESRRLEVATVHFTADFADEYRAPEDHI